MSKYSDKVKRRMEEARRQIAKPLPPAPHEPTAARPSDGLALEARARCLTIVGDVHESLRLAHDLIVRVATVSDRWARCGVKFERGIAANVKAQCRSAVTTLDKCLRGVARSDFAPLEATNAASPFTARTRPQGDLRTSTARPDQAPARGKSPTTGAATTGAADTQTGTTALTQEPPEANVA